MSAALHRVSRSSVRLCSTPISVLLNGRRTFLPKYVKPTLAAIAAKKKRHPMPVSPRSSYLEWNYPAELHAFSARLGETVEEGQLREVFTERSYIIQAAEERRRLGLPAAESEAADNAALSSRGRTVLTSHTSGWLRAAFPRMPEEGVQAVTSHLTSQNQLAELAVGIGMKDLVLAEEYPASEEALVRCLEAFVGALASSASPHRADLFVRDFVIARLAVTDISSMWNIEDPLAVLSDTLERCGRAAPEPRLLRSAGPGSLLAVYVVGIYSNRRLLGSAPGESVTEATQLAARVCLDRLMGVGNDDSPPDLSADTSQSRQPADCLADWRPL